LPFVPSWQLWQAALSSFCETGVTRLLLAAAAALVIEGLAMQTMAATSHSMSLENRVGFVPHKIDDISIPLIASNT
jgi:hypothetical protein